MAGSFYRYMDMKNRKTFVTPAGRLLMTEEDGFITGLERAGKEDFDSDSDTINKAIAELREYFSGERKTFTVPVKQTGTPFQMSVWQALRDIPYGETRTYKDIAIAIGRPNACRAVGNANHVNSVLIFTPCHRVIGADGSLTGFAAGMEMKKYLLELEQKNKAPTNDR